jgi:DNA-3-methyladenine glycosylase II
MQANGFTINTIGDLERAAQALMGLDERFGVLHERNGPPPLRARPGGLEGLAWIVTGQLISAKAAAAIWRRVSAALSPFDASEVCAMAETELAALGLTRAKARTIIAAAKAERDGAFDHAALCQMDDAAASSALMSLKGIGRWSADIYLLSCLGRPDAWPAGDLAVRSGLQGLLGLETLPPVAAMDALAEGWRPWRAVAARYLWEQHVSMRQAKAADPAA